MNNFVIQHHALATSEHWDLMLEQTHTLVTWQVPLSPEKWADHAVKCRKLPDHRKIYLTYEGPVSNNRGEVHIVFRGIYKLINATASRWQFDLISDTLRLKINLERNMEEPDSCVWTLAASPLPDK